MGRGSDTAAVLAGAAAGHAIGSSIGRSMAVRGFKKEMYKQLIGDFGPIPTTDVFVMWVEGGGDMSMSYRLEAEKQSQNRLYKDVLHLYGEEAADFLDARINKSREKGVRYDFDADLAAFLAEKGMELKNKRFVSQYFKLLYEIQPESNGLRNALMSYGNPPGWLRLFGIGFSLAFFVVVMWIMYKLDVSSGVLFGAIVVMLFLAPFSARKLSQKIALDHFQKQQSDLVRLYKGFEKRFYDAMGIVKSDS